MHLLVFIVFCSQCKLPVVATTDSIVVIETSWLMWIPTIGTCLATFWLFKSIRTVKCIWIVEAQHRCLTYLGVWSKRKWLFSKMKMKQNSHWTWTFSNQFETRRKKSNDRKSVEYTCVCRRRRKIVMANEIIEFGDLILFFKLLWSASKVR
jgi:hypothetical protein